MNKIKTIKIKEIDGTISNTTYLIGADASSIDMQNEFNVQETIGTINVYKDGDIATQLKNLKIKLDGLIDGETQSY